MATDSLCTFVSGSVLLSQNADSCAKDSNGSNELVLEVEDAGGGPYIVMRTERFAVDVPSAERLLDAIKRLLSLAETAQEHYETGKEEAAQ